MPIVIPKDIPAYSTLNKENIFVITSKRANTQDIRPIEIAIVNLMPTKIETETQLMRVLSNSPLQINVTLINTESYISKNTSTSHLQRFYKTFSEVKNQIFDGMIITGAPVESLEFEDVLYWKELTEIFEFSKTNVTSTVYICWGAQAALHYFYNIDKYPLAEKMFGIFPHRKNTEFDPLLKGIDDIFYLPHSRHTTNKIEDIKAVKDLKILALSDKAGASILKSKDNKRIFISGHMEYDRYTLKGEYERDINKGLQIKPPENYFSDSKFQNVDMKWSATANLFFSNWLNYYVYQVTPFDLSKIIKGE
jgi:homoserine O-succinyltransferase